MSRATRLFVLITGFAMLMSACASYTECTGPRCDRSNSNTRLIPPDRLLFHRVEFSDNVSGSPYNIELEADKESRLNYSLTAELLDDVEAQGPIASESAREALSAGKSLEVVFRCSVCNFEDNVQAPQEIRYDPSTLRTNEIVFQFTPIESDAVDNWQPLGTEPGVTLILYENGVRHDQLHIPVAVNSKSGVRIDSLNDSPADKFSNSNARDQRAETNIFKIAQSTDILELPPKPPFEIYSDAQPTLTISIYSGSGASQNLVVEARLQRPRDKDSARLLETQLASFGISAADLYGKKIEFVTAFSSFSDLGAALGETYDALSCLVLRNSSSKSTNPQTPSFRRRSLDRLGDIRCDDWVGIPYRWTPENPSAEAAANRIFLEGRQLYSDLFGSSVSGSELRPIMDALSNISHARIDGFLPGGPIKIRTHSQIHVPFQFLILSKVKTSVSHIAFRKKCRFMMIRVGVSFSVPIPLEIRNLLLPKMTATHFGIAATCPIALVFSPVSTIARLWRLFRKPENRQRTKRRLGAGTISSRSFA